MNSIQQVTHFRFPLQHSFETFSHLKAIYSRDLGWLGETASSVRYPPFDGTNKGKYMSFLMQNRDTTFNPVGTNYRVTLHVGNWFGWDVPPILPSNQAPSA